MNFRAGNIIKGKKCNGYSVTNHLMTRAKVLKVYEAYGTSNMKIQILDHMNRARIGETYDVVNTELKFELLQGNDCIVIYRRDNETIAFNKTTKEKAVAKCSPEDTFDFKVGAKIALGRLIGEDLVSKPKEPKPYGGKIVCVEAPGRMGQYYTEGKVYTLVNGRFKDDKGIETPSSDCYPAYSVEDINKYNASCRFVELIEEDK